MSSAKRTHIRKDAEDVPVPHWVSPALLAYHANPDMVNRPIKRVPALDDRASWNKIFRSIDRMNDDLGQKTGQIAAFERTYTTTGPFKIAGVDCYLSEPKSGVPAANQDKLFLQVHGGAYTLYTGSRCARNVQRIPDICQVRALSIDYRSAPDHPFPAALDDVAAVYLALLSTPNLIPGRSGTYKPSQIGMFGVSAGGGLIAATVLYLKDNKHPLPAAVALFTPWAELDEIGDSRFTNKHLDLSLFEHAGGVLEASAKLYAGSYSLKHPYISPVYGDPRGWPPTIFVSGTRDLLLSDSCRLHRALRNAGNRDTELHVTEGIYHSVTGLPGVPECESTDGEVARWFAKYLGLQIKEASKL
ncbi:alpha/beta hydrolase fold-domain-containing protein [Hyaloraphidium curvatum]|nr:alpha/beta hydrolase fold-domain-containing protein [Hyaloraphidium curvatum]